MSCETCPKSPYSEMKDGKRMCYCSRYNRWVDPGDGSFCFFDPNNLDKLKAQPINEWNRRYVQYARCHGHTPFDMIYIDHTLSHSAVFPFMCWNNEMWRQFDKLYPGYKIGDGHTDEGHRLYDKWLTTLPVRILPYPVLFALEYLDVRYEG